MEIVALPGDLTLLRERAFKLRTFLTRCCPASPSPSSVASLSWWQSYKSFSSSTLEKRTNKLECFFLPRLLSLVWYLRVRLGAYRTGHSDRPWSFFQISGNAGNVFWLQILQLFRQLYFRKSFCFSLARFFRSSRIFSPGGGPECPTLWASPPRLAGEC